MIEGERAREQERERVGRTDRASVPGADNILFTYLNLQLTYLNFVVLDEILNLLSSTAARNLLLRASSQRNSLRVCHLNEQRCTSVASRREEEVHRIVRICICQGRLEGSSMRRSDQEHNGCRPQRRETSQRHYPFKKKEKNVFHVTLTRHSYTVLVLSSRFID